MNYINRSILKNVKSGQYFIDAINWYERKYIYPFTERAILLIITMVFLIASMVTMKYTYDIFPLQSYVSFPILTKDIDKNIPIIKKVANSKESATYSLAKYLLSNYVITRESYEYDSLQDRLELIRNTSFRKVYDEYAQQLDFSNVDSPIYKYQNSAVRKIEIIEVTNDKEFDKVDVLFSAKVVNYLGKVLEESKWKSQIEFVITDIEKRVSNKLNFLVSEYKVEQIK